MWGGGGKEGITWKNEEIEIRSGGRWVPVIGGFGSRWCFSHSRGQELPVGPHIYQDWTAVIGRARVQKNKKEARWLDETTEPAHSSCSLIGRNQTASPPSSLSLSVIFRESWKEQKQKNVYFFCFYHTSCFYPVSVQEFKVRTKVSVDFATVRPNGRESNSKAPSCGGTWLRHGPGSTRETFKFYFNSSEKKKLIFRLFKLFTAQLFLDGLDFCAMWNIIQYSSALLLLFRCLLNVASVIPSKLTITQVKE